jgi:hypothetical protein
MVTHSLAFRFNPLQIPAKPCVYRDLNNLRAIIIVVVLDEFLNLGIQGLFGL